MSDLKIKAYVSPDHKLTADVPPEIPPGEHEITLPAPEVLDIAARNKELIDFLKSLERQPNRKSRAKEDIDRQIEEERNSWE
ncbi:MAG: hypothetical protein IT462_03210 [Planctomycetes bacterium]|nr:hypothetical protein [Planctomycetota bacterium]